VCGQFHAPAALPQGKSPQYPLDRMLSEPQSLSEHSGKEKNYQPLPGIKPYYPDHPACSLVTIPSELSWLIKFSPKIK